MLSTSTPPTSDNQINGNPTSPSSSAATERLAQSQIKTEARRQLKLLKDRIKEEQRSATGEKHTKLIAILDNIITNKKSSESPVATLKEAEEAYAVTMNGSTNTDMPADTHTQIGQQETPLEEKEPASSNGNTPQQNGHALPTLDAAPSPTDANNKPKVLTVDTEAHEQGSSDQDNDAAPAPTQASDNEAQQNDVVESSPESSISTSSAPVANGDSSKPVMNTDRSSKSEVTHISYEVQDADEEEEEEEEEEEKEQERENEVQTSSDGEDSDLDDSIRALLLEKSKQLTTEEPGEVDIFSLTPHRTTVQETTQVFLTPPIATPPLPYTPPPVSVFTFSPPPASIGTSQGSENEGNGHAAADAPDSPPYAPSPPIPSAYLVNVNRQAPGSSIEMNPLNTTPPVNNANPNKDIAKNNVNNKGPRRTPPPIPGLNEKGANNSVGSGTTPPNDEKTTVSATQQLAAYTRIYSALRVAQTSLHKKTNWPAKQNPTMSDEARLMALKTHASDPKNKDSRSKAMLDMVNGKYQDQELANRILEAGFKKSSIFARTKISGQTIYRAKTLTRFFEKNGYNVQHAGVVTKDTRMGKIMGELGMGLPPQPATTGMKKKP